jgi:hypothetical protein
MKGGFSWRYSSCVISDSSGETAFQRCAAAGPGSAQGSKSLAEPLDQETTQAPQCSGWQPRGVCFSWGQTTELCRPSSPHSCRPQSQRRFPDHRHRQVRCPGHRHHLPGLVRSASSPELAWLDAPATNRLRHRPSKLAARAHRRGLSAWRGDRGEIHGSLFGNHVKVSQQGRVSHNHLGNKHRRVGKRGLDHALHVQRRHAEGHFSSALALPALAMAKFSKDRRVSRVGASRGPMREPC